MVVKVSDIIHSDYAAYQREGRDVFFIIENELRRNEREIIVSFEGVNACSKIFLNECIGRLYCTYNTSELDNVLSFINFFQLDTFENMLQKAKMSSCVTGSISVHTDSHTPAQLSTT